MSVAAVSKNKTNFMRGDYYMGAAALSFHLTVNVRRDADRAAQPVVSPWPWTDLLLGPRCFRSALAALALPSRPRTDLFFRLLLAGSPVSRTHRHRRPS